MPQSWEGRGEVVRGGGCVGTWELLCLSSPLLSAITLGAPLFGQEGGGWDL